MTGCFQELPGRVADERRGLYRWQPLRSRRVRKWTFMLSCSSVFFSYGTTVIQNNKQYALGQDILTTNVVAAWIIPSNLESGKWKPEKGGSNQAPRFVVGEGNLVTLNKMFYQLLKWFRRWWMHLNIGNPFNDIQQNVSVFPMPTGCSIKLRPTTQEPLQYSRNL